MKLIDGKCIYIALHTHSYHSLPYTYMAVNTLKGYHLNIRSSNSSHMHSLQPPWCTTGAKDHIWCHSCHATTENWSDSWQGLIKVGQQKIGKLCLAWWVRFLLEHLDVKVRISHKQHKAWIHPITWDEFMLKGVFLVQFWLLLHHITKLKSSHTAFLNTKK